MWWLHRPVSEQQWSPAWPARSSRGPGRVTAAPRGPVLSSRPPPTPMPSFKGQARGQSPVDWSNRPGVWGVVHGGGVGNSGLTGLCKRGAQNLIHSGSWLQGPRLAWVLSKHPSCLFQRWILLQPVEDPSWVFCPAVQARMSLTTFLNLKALIWKRLILLLPPSPPGSCENDMGLAGRASLPEGRVLRAKPQFT